MKSHQIKAWHEFSFVECLYRLVTIKTLLPWYLSLSVWATLQCNRFYNCRKQGSNDFLSGFLKQLCEHNCSKIFNLNKVGLPGDRYQSSGIQSSDDWRIWLTPLRRCRKVHPQMWSVPLASLMFTHFKNPYSWPRMTALQSEKKSLCGCFSEIYLFNNMLFVFREDWCFIEHIHTDIDNMDTYPQVTISKLGGKGVCQFIEVRAWAVKKHLSLYNPGKLASCQCCFRSAPKLIHCLLSLLIDC